MVMYAMGGSRSIACLLRAGISYSQIFSEKKKHIETGLTGNYMRQRRPKNLEEKIIKHKSLLIDEPVAMKGKWRSAFNTSTDTCTPKLYLEIGSGKGKFINQLAIRHQEDLFVGFEGQDTVIIRALEKIRSNELSNIKMCRQYINDFDEFFGSDELDGIYLNFSDPWPKDRHAKRRLTSHRYLPGYATSIKSGGFIKMKTDNDDLFAYSLEQFGKNHDFDIVETSEDLHNSELSKGNVMTEYEKKFSNFGKKINYVCVIRK